MAGAGFIRALDSFVSDDTDIVGLIAYALYKQRKRDWIIDFKRENGGIQPEKESIAEFERAMLLENSVFDLKSKAESALIAYAESLLEERRPRIREEALTSEFVSDKDVIIQSQSFWRQVLQAFIVSVVTTALLVLLAISIGIFGIDIIDGSNTVRDVVGDR